MQVLVVSRGLVGFGLGGVHVALTLFTEFAPTRNRGAMMTLIESFWTIGSIIEAGLAWWLLPWVGWRGLLGVSTLPLGPVQNP